MGRVTTVAAFGFHWHMLIDKRTLFIRVALDTDRVPTRHRSYLAEGGRAVSVMAVTTLHKALIDSMVIGLCEVRLGGGMAPIAEVGLRPHKQVLGFLRMVRGVAV